MIVYKRDISQSHCVVAELIVLSFLSQAMATGWFLVHLVTQFKVEFFQRQRGQNLWTCLVDKEV